MPYIKLIVDIGTFLVISTTGKETTEDKDSSKKTVIVRLMDKQEDEDNRILLQLYTFEAQQMVIKSPVPCYWARIESILTVDLCFVFNKQTEENSSQQNLLGRKDSFFILQGIREFPCSHPLYPLAGVSLSSSVFNEMEGVRLLLRKLMCRMTMHQSECATSVGWTYLSEVTYKYFRRQLQGMHGVTFKSDSTKTRIDYEILNGMVATSKRCRLACSSTCFYGEGGINALVALFGQLSVVGLRQRRPKLADPPQQLVQNDIVNYFEEGDNDCVSTFDMREDGKLYIRVAYRAYHYVSGIKGTPLNCPSSAVHAVITRQLLKRKVPPFAGSILVVGSQFSMSNKLYTVVAVNKGVSRVTSGRDGADDEEDMPNDHLEQLIMEYLE